MKNSENELLLEKMQESSNEKDDKIKELQRKIDDLCFDLQTMHQEKPALSEKEGLKEDIISSASQNFEQNINFIENGIQQMFETQVNF